MNRASRQFYGSCQNLLSQALEAHSAAGGKDQFGEETNKQRLIHFIAGHQLKLEPRKNEHISDFGSSILRGRFFIGSQRVDKIQYTVSQLKLH